MLEIQELASLKQEGWAGGPCLCSVASLSFIKCLLQCVVM